MAAPDGPAYCGEDRIANIIVVECEVNEALADRFSQSQRIELRGGTCHQELLLRDEPLRQCGGDQTAERVNSCEGDIKVVLVYIKDRPALEDINGFL